VLQLPCFELDPELSLRSQRPVVGEGEWRTRWHQVPLLHQGGPGEDVRGYLEAWGVWGESAWGVWRECVGSVERVCGEKVLRECVGRGCLGSV